MRKLLSVILVAGLLASAVCAGDLATLVNLGFSDDSAYFMFGFYGMDTGSGKPYAEIYLVDTKKNDFVPNGSFKGMYAKDLEPGWNPAGSFFKLFSEAVPLARSLKIDHLSQGRLIYTQADEEILESIEFDDYKTGDHWSVHIKKAIEESGSKLSSSFGLSVRYTKKGAAPGSPAASTVSISAGNPHIKRSNIEDYTISQILLAPDGKTVAVLIERVEKGSTGKMIRYMVETFRLP